MPDFLIAPCTVVNASCRTPGIICKEITTQTLFGICDNPPPDCFPAYVQFHTPNDWIAEVQNSLGKEVVFKAVDFCVDVRRPDGKQESRCDGFLIYDDNNLIFFELKDRNSNGWLSKGREQIEITIAHFALNHNPNNFVFNDSYVCNKQRPFAVPSIITEVQKFKNNTSKILGGAGLLLRAERIIIIP